MQTLNIRIRGKNSLLINNPQMSDPLNKFQKEMKTYTSKRNKTDEDIIKMREIEVRAKIYWDEKIGVYVPSTWVVAAIAGVSWTKGKIKKSDIRSAVFPSSGKLKLHYTDMSKVVTPLDIVKNQNFHNVISMKQGQVRVVKATPIFNNWYFDVSLDFDPSIINEAELKALIEYSSTYGGFGDFRPTHGRADVEYLD